MNKLLVLINHIWLLVENGYQFCKGKNNGMDESGTVDICCPFLPYMTGIVRIFKILS
jgi:hypothetical protein